MRLVSQVIVQVPRCFICSIKSPNVVVKWLKGFWNWSTYDWARASGSPVTCFGSPCSSPRANNQGWVSNKQDVMLTQYHGTKVIPKLHERVEEGNIIWNLRKFVQVWKGHYNKNSVYIYSLTNQVMFASRKDNIYYD